MTGPFPHTQLRSWRKRADLVTQWEAKTTHMAFHWAQMSGLTSKADSTIQAIQRAAFIYLQTLLQWLVQTRACCGKQSICNAFGGYSMYQRRCSVLKNIERIECKNSWVLCIFFLILSCCSLFCLFVVLFCFWITWGYWRKCNETQRSIRSIKYLLELKHLQTHTRKEWKLCWEVQWN